MTRDRKGFTLVEVLVSVALTGLVASLVFAPVAYVVRQVTETEEAYSGEAALRRAVMFMAQDAVAGLRLASTVVRVINHEEFGGSEDDTFIVASSAQAKQNLAAGSIAYRVLRRSLFASEARTPGLYRWLIPGVLPESVDHDALPAEEGQLVIPYVDGLSLSVFDPPEWVSDYSGTLPRGMKFVLLRGIGNDGNGGNDIDEEKSIEYVVSLPR